MGKQDRQDGSETGLTDIDPEKAPERRYEETLESARGAMAREGKGSLVEVIKDWLHE